MHRFRRIVGGRRAVPPSRASAPAGSGVLLARSRYLFISCTARASPTRIARRAARRDRRGRRLALLGRARRPLLRHELPGGGRVQRRPRHPVHRRSDAQDADLHRDAAARGAGGHGPAPPFRPRGDADARATKASPSKAMSTFSTAARPCPRRPTRSARSTKRATEAIAEIARGRHDEDAARRRPPQGFRAPASARSSARPTTGVVHRPERPPSCSASRTATRPRRRALMACSSRSISTGSSGPATIMPGSASAISPPPPMPARSRTRARRRCRASRRCAHNLALGLAQGIFAAAPRGRTGTGSPRSAPTIEDCEPALARRRLLGLGDVGGQCGDRLARARHRGRPLPPDRRQPAHHAASQPRMAGDARAAPPRLRQRRAFRGPRAGAAARSATRARPIICGSAPAHGAPGVEIFVYGVTRRRLPCPPASRGLARDRPAARARSGRAPCSSEQSEEAIAAGAFHNDVVAVANEHVLFAHEQAFADKRPATPSCERLLPEVEIVEVPAARGQLADAITLLSVQRPAGDAARGRDGADPARRGARDAAVWSWLEQHVAGNGPIRRLEVVDVRQSMANGGGPACLRLRVVADPATVDPRFLVDEAKLDRLSEVVRTHWPVAVDTADIQKPALIADIEGARRALLERARSWPARLIPKRDKSAPLRQS